jgi:hypothetical protein
MNSSLRFGNLPRQLIAASFIAAALSTAMGDEKTGQPEPARSERVVQVVPASEPEKSAAALIMNDDTLRCPLQEGETTFVIKLPASVLDRVTFLNENAAAAGELKIFVANDQLPAASAKWTAVDGRVAFAHKRRFDVSLLGVDARYVKLEFNVQKASRTAASRDSAGTMLASN